MHLLPNNTANPKAAQNSKNKAKLGLKYTKNRSFSSKSFLPCKYQSKLQSSVVWLNAVNIATCYNLGLSEKANIQQQLQKIS